MTPEYLKPEIPRPCPRPRDDTTLSSRTSAARRDLPLVRTPSSTRSFGPNTGLRMTAKSKSPLATLGMLPPLRSGCCAIAINFVPDERNSAPLPPVQAASLTKKVRGLFLPSLRPSSLLNQRCKALSQKPQPGAHRLLCYAEPLGSLFLVESFCQQKNKLPVLPGETLLNRPVRK